jgi:hypothetical protein
MQNVPISIPVNQSITVNVNNRTCYYESGSATGGADERIKVQTNGGGEGEMLLRPGQGFKIDGRFQTLVISNYANAGTITGNLVFTDGDFFDHRVVGMVSISGVVSVTGNVNVIDNRKSNTLAGISFLSVFGVPSGGADTPKALIMNPAGSGKNITIKKLHLSTSTTQPVKWDFYSTLLATAGGNSRSKLSPGAAGVAVLKYDNAAAWPGGAPGTLGRLLLTANQSYTVTLEEPIVLTPGNGLAMFGLAVGSDITVLIEHNEE